MDSTEVWKEKLNNCKIKMNQHIKKQIKWLCWTFILNVIGLIIFKYIPMHIYGKDILFDASSHVAWTGFGLYFIWFFVDQNKSWRIPFFILSGVILIFMSIQRILEHQHNELGIMLGFFVIGLAIIIPRFKEFRKRLKF
jgi:membrane-associated phospholipid phosphatase